MADMEEFDLRGVLAAELKCWHRLRDDEVDNLMAFVRKLAQQPAVPPVFGDLLPPIGSRVYIRHARDEDAHACIVTGYYAWGDLGGNKHLNRVFVRMVYEGTSTQQARMLCDCYPTPEDALSAASEATAQTAVPPGYKLVPVDRRKFEDAVRSVWTDGYNCHIGKDMEYNRPAVKFAWHVTRAMLNAAPEAPAAQKEQP